MVGNGGGISGLVMGLALRCNLVLLTDQRFAQGIAHANDLQDGTCQLQSSFHIGATQYAEAGAGQQGHHTGVLHRHGHGRIGAEIDFLAVPEQQA
ncbi:hypothetical protein D3C76_1105330 [compost metagenome]